jgi:hypothetical protein
VAEIKRSLKYYGVEIPVTEVPIVRRSEIPSEYELEDGTIIRVSTPVAAVLRVDGFPDPEGNPIFWVRNGTVVNMIEGPRDKAKGNGSDTDSSSGKLG